MSKKIKQISAGPSLSLTLVSILLSSLLIVRSIHALEVPLEFHGNIFLGKYLSNSIRYNMDASIDIHCRILAHKQLTLFGRYRDDLDMAEQEGGVSLDPRYAHYYIVGGFDYRFSHIFIASYFMHDCVHDIDIEDEGTPVFNRFRLQIASRDYYMSERVLTPRFYVWSIELGFYPHWNYHGWDINAGADYQYDLIATGELRLLQHEKFGFMLYPYFHVTKGDSDTYHQHALAGAVYYRTPARRIGIEIKYNIYNNDIIKDPHHLWLLSLFLNF